MGLKSYVAKRAVYSLVLIFAAMTVDFLIFAMLPGNPMQAYMANVENRITPARYAELAEYFGLGKPLHERFISYVHNMLTWNFEWSFNSGNPVAGDILSRLPNTLLLMGTAEILSIVFGVLLGVITAHKRGGLFDTGLVTGSLVTYSVPIFFIAWMIIFAFAVNLHWFPVGGTTPVMWGRNPPANLIEFIAGRLHYIILPAFTLFLFSVGGWILLTRACVLETITEDYVVTARAKGLKQRTVLYKHILKNASLPLITSVALTFGFLISGAIITETLFNYNGMGLLIWGAIHPPDLPLLQAIFYVIALVVIVANFVADLLYGIIDPRIKYG